MKARRKKTEKTGVFEIYVTKGGEQRKEADLMATIQQNSSLPSP